MAYDKYLFAAGAIKEVEKRFLGDGDMERMIDAPTLSDSFRVFNDLNYTDELLDIRDPEKYPEALSHDLGQVKYFLEKMLDDNELLMGMFAQDDFFNLKAVFKAKYLLQAEATGLSPHGYIDAKKLASFVGGEAPAVKLPVAYEAVVARAKEAASEKWTAVDYDYYFEKEYYSFVLAVAERLRDPLIKKITACQIDISNIKVLLRSQLLFHKPGKMAHAFVEGGRLDKGKLEAWLELDESDIVEKLAFALDDSITVAELRKWARQAELWKLDRVLDAHLGRVIREVNYIESSPAIPWVFYIKKIRSQKNLSIIMTGKINNIDTHNIKERIRHN